MSVKLPMASAQPSFGWPLKHVDFAACCNGEFASRVQHVTLLPRRTATQVLKN
jgi:hypothetical protein